MATHCYSVDIQSDMLLALYVVRLMWVVGLREMITTFPFVQNQRRFTNVDFPQTPLINSFVD